MKRILIVEDAATVRMYYRGVLEAAGYQIEEAINGIEGLEKSLLSPWDLLIVDINMGKLDGPSMLREIRQRDERQIPALVTSTEAGKGDRMEALRSGANAFLSKPVSEQLLVRYVQMLLGEVAA